MKKPIVPGHLPRHYRPAPLNLAGVANCMSHTVPAVAPPWPRPPLDPLRTRVGGMLRTTAGPRTVGGFFHRPRARSLVLKTASVILNARMGCIDY
jgi:hypothetical protein